MEYRALSSPIPIQNFLVSDCFCTGHMTINSKIALSGSIISPVFGTKAVSASLDYGADIRLSYGAIVHPT